MFLDDQFHTLVQNSGEIDELVRLIQKATPRPRDDGCEPSVPAPPKATTLTIVSGFGQQGAPGKLLPNRFFVEVRDQYGDPFPGATVNFTVEGGGRLLPAIVRTNNIGRASTTLTLGPDPGVYSVVASVEGIKLTQTFTTIAIAVDEPRKATTLAIVSGDDQKGQTGTLLQDPFVVEVWDQNGKVLADIDVEFRVTAGGGSLSLTRVRTNNTGKASVTLTLGSGKEKNRVIASVVGVGVSLTQPFTAEAFNADVNKDGVVSIIDLSIFLSLIEQPNRPITGIDMDINDDEIVDHEDLVLLVSALESTAAAPSVHVLAQGGISAADLRTLLTQAKALPEAIQADPVYQRGIVGLERLLAILTQVPAVPKQTALLVNYPNPFNPETWIPYQLSEASDVTLDIYAMNGSRVRTLALGHRAAGLYQRKSRAAYWDGRNEFGEPVASGLYFYTLTAGDFTATRKMLIRK